ncbi:MAG TPA: hypothetical protein VGO61_13820 [Steroidobacteraceae bacterium]|jgi:hypothetical protein|nr:hypothetical protein [Steroidobacteraceae bacterium]
MKTGTFAAVAAACLLACPFSASAYENFKVAIYCRAQEVQKMADPKWLADSWEAVSREVHVDKVYIETHRDRIVVSDATLEAVKKFFMAHGVAVAGGITFTVSEPNRFETFSYSNPEHRQQVREIAELTARHFDEFILDDFFFTSTKSKYDVAARGPRSWTDYRLAVMEDAATNLVIGPAKRVNPKVKVVIKYPNWYDHFPALGFNLARGPKLFDGIYTGTETRDAVRSAQHLQPYLSYNIMRYFDNISPGRNGGGWVDTGGATFYDRYAEQLWLTLFAKAAPEITLFDLRQMLYPLDAKKSAPRQSMRTTFSFADVVKPVSSAGQSFVPQKYARVAGVSFEVVDKVLGALGKPIGIKSYKPYNSLGEDFLQNYLGMAGIPIEMVPEFPADEAVVLLTAQAAADKNIVSLIEAQLKRGKNVVITSGLLKALQGRGIQRIVEMEDSGRVASVDSFIVGRGEVVKADKPMLIPQITYRTNDSWELVSAVDGDNGWPVLHDADYLDGQLQVLTIPENFADLSNYPEPVLDAIRRVITAALPVHLEAPGKVSLFVYDNRTFIVHNFRDEPVNAKVTMPEGIASIADLTADLSTKESISTVKREERARVGVATIVTSEASFAIAPHSFRAFRME